MKSAIRNPHQDLAAIFLVGFMASGKTTVGAALASLLDRRFIDLDEWIVARAGCFISDLIAREGEERFRQLETEALREAASCSAIVAPGGGAITRSENRELMSQAGVMIWLDAPFELCWQRIRHDKVVRPLAATEKVARERYLQRLPLYQQASLRIAINSHQTPEEIAKAIKLQLSR